SRTGSQHRTASTSGLAASDFCSALADCTTVAKPSSRRTTPRGSGVACRRPAGCSSSTIPVTTEIGERSSSKCCVFTWTSEPHDYVPIASRDENVRPHHVSGASVLRDSGTRNESKEPARTFPCWPLVPSLNDYFFVAPVAG